jgi:TPR repeat protein
MKTTIKTMIIGIPLLIFTSTNTIADGYYRDLTSISAHKSADTGLTQEQIKRFDDAMTRRDYEGALRLVYPLAERGNAQAQRKVAYVYDVRGDLQEAIKWYQMAVDQNNTIAEYNLGVLYYNNHDALCGKRRNLFDTQTIICGFKLNATALALWRKAAGQGDQWSKDALANHEAAMQQQQQDIAAQDRQYEESQREALRWTLEHPLGR